MLAFALDYAHGQNVGFMGKTEDVSAMLDNDAPIMQFAGVGRALGIASSLEAEFSTIPADDEGLVDVHLVSHLVHTYFMRTKGWQFRGFERSGYGRDAPMLHEIHAVKETFPDLWSSLRRAELDSSRFSLDTVSKLVAVIEKMYVDLFEMDLFYEMSARGVSPLATVDRPFLVRVLHDFLTKYDVTFSRRTGQSVNFVEAVLNQVDYDNRFISNPFKTTITYDPDQLTQIVELIIGGYNTVQQDGCKRMADQMQSNSHDGMLPVTINFPTYMREEGFEFSESIQYLEAVGAMETGGSKVWLSNYMMGPSNCDDQLFHVATCCVNLCYPISRAIATGLRAHEGAPSTIIDIVSSLASRYVKDVPRTLPVQYIDRLHAIANEHDGVVQVHSRSFDHWLHLVFPDECPFPVITSKDDFRTHGHWLHNIYSQDRQKVSKEKTERFLSHSWKANLTQKVWEVDDVLYAKRPESKGIPVKRFLLWAAMVASLCTVVWALRDLSSWPKSLEGLQSTNCGPKVRTVDTDTIPGMFFASSQNV